MENTLNGGKSQFSLQDLMKALADTEDGQRPVEKWNPDYCGEMDMVIKVDGSWWHEGSPLTRRGLIDLFASILRKDEDGETYLVTPVEKIKIVVERAPFVAVRADIEGEGETQRIFFTTNLDEVVEAGPDHPIRVETDPQTLEPAPFMTIRGRLEASLKRSVFYELVEHAVERDTDEGKQLGIWASGTFFPLGPAGAHEV
ncbi:DUF1285 domain-containing protein [Hellea balneolensis]|uniref:DUF1285 domain-containing protein n=1 Tax=Hellea balneolensis TaxID=287478 RepID=UPI00054CF8E9|nr:DUF1285 domain-containing protein [Hellea balneolensis]